MNSAIVNNQATQSGEASDEDTTSSDDDDNPSQPLQPLQPLQHKQPIEANTQFSQPNTSSVPSPASSQLNKNKQDLLSTDTSKSSNHPEQNQSQRLVDLPNTPSQIKLASHLHDSVAMIQGRVIHAVRSTTEGCIQQSYTDTLTCCNQLQDSYHNLQTTFSELDRLPSIMNTLLGTLSFPPQSTQTK